MVHTRLHVWGVPIRTTGEKAEHSAYTLWFGMSPSPFLTINVPVVYGDRERIRNENRDKVRGRGN